MRFNWLVSPKSCNDSIRGSKLIVPTDFVAVRLTDLPGFWELGLCFPHDTDAGSGHGVFVVTVWHVNLLNLAGMAVQTYEI